MSQWSEALFQRVSLSRHRNKKLPPSKRNSHDQHSKDGSIYGTNVAISQKDRNESQIYSTLGALPYDDNIIQDGSEDDQQYRTPNVLSQDDGINSLANVDEIHDADLNLNLDGDVLNLNQPNQDDFDEDKGRKKKAKKDKKTKKLKKDEKNDNNERKKEKKRLRKLKKEQDGLHN